MGLKAPVTIYENSRIKCNDSHRALAKQAAVESMVLLKNDKGTLPISPMVKKVAVLGANIPYTSVDGGNGSSGANRMVNFATEVRTGDLGSSRAFSDPDPTQTVGPAAGITMTAPAGVNVVSGNQRPTWPRTPTSSSSWLGSPRRTRARSTRARATATSFALDAKQPIPSTQNIQNKLITDAAALGKPMVVVLEGGSVIDMPWLGQVPAVVMAWYPGQRGGEALGDLLWGQVNGVSVQLQRQAAHHLGQAAERLRQLHRQRNDDHARSTTTSAIGGSIRQGTQPLFPFGAGLSYTTFEYRKLQLGCSDMSKGAVLPVVVNVANTGTVDGDEIVMVFVSFPEHDGPARAEGAEGVCARSSGGRRRKAGHHPAAAGRPRLFPRSTPTTPPRVKWVVEDGPVNIMVGGSAASLPLTATVNVKGYTVGSSQ